MLTVEKAQQAVLQTAQRLPAEFRPLQEALGLVLSEDVASDLDMPPYDKALVDGFAVRAADLPEGRGELAVVGEIFAGNEPWSAELRLSAGLAVRIMTGAPIPPGADAVVMVERSELRSQRSEVRDGPSQRSGAPAISNQARSAGTVADSSTAQPLVRIDDPRLTPGQNIMRRATEMTSGQCVLRAGTSIRPQEIGVLAAVGRSNVPVYPRPRVAIVSTGNEIVEAEERPEPGQIRNSNGPMLAALVDRAGGNARYLGIARDTSADLRRCIATGLEADVLLLSGGVSAGELDLVPGVLRELGVRQVFHRVNLKPGKPVWFGVASQAISDQQLAISRSPCLVFGLPGNPVSVMVCFELFVRPAIRWMMGFRDSRPRLIRATLTDERSSRSDRPTYWPAWLEQTDDGLRVRPVAWKGSPDLRAITDANAFAILPPGDYLFRAGDQVEVLCTEY